MDKTDVDERKSVFNKRSSPNATLAEHKIQLVKSKPDSTEERYPTNEKMIVSPRSPLKHEEGGGPIRPPALSNRLKYEVYFVEPSA